MDVDVSSMTAEAYNNLIKYAIKKCNVVSFFRRYDQDQEGTEKIKSIVFSEGDLNINFCYEEIENIVKKYSDNVEIKKYCLFKILERGPKFFFPIDFFLINSSFSSSIELALEQIYYDSNIEKFIKDNHSRFLKKEDSFFDECSLERNHISDHKLMPVYGTEYYFHLDDTMYEELVFMKNSIYDWDYPKSIMDICFYKDDKEWLHSEAHEEICWIECENKEEFEYLKSIGVMFKHDLDDEGEKLRFVFNNKTYYLVKNVQGDILKVVD